MNIEFSRMLSYIVKRDRFFYLVSAFVLALIAFWLPDIPGPRAWACFLLSLLLPFIVVGRTARRASGGWLHASRGARRGRRVFIAQWLIYATLIGSFALIGGGGEWNATYGLFIWGAALVALADLVDRVVVFKGRVWTRLLALGLVLLTIPLWLAPWYGQTDWSPALATYGIGLHPAAFVLSAFEQPTLQDPLLYRLTLSGVVEVRPLWWGYGQIFYSVFGLGCFALSALVERRIDVDDKLVVI